jgi:hypothetical protein
MATVLLLHGAWHGAWAWDRVRPRLEASGHTVYTPTFAGVGERAYELHQGHKPPIGLETHIGNIVNYVEQRHLHDLTVVAHSYAGVPLTAAIPRILPAVRHLVYLDAFYPIPRHERVAAMLTLRNTPAWLWPWKAQLMKGVALSQPVPPPPLRFLGITNPADKVFVRERLTDMPLRFLDGGRRLDPPPDSLCTYIWCGGSGKNMGEGFVPYAQTAQRRGWQYFEIPTGHDAMITAPHCFAQVLHLIVGGGSPLTPAEHPVSERSSMR